jgi:hypothetical protein
VGVFERERVGLFKVLGNEKEQEREGRGLLLPKSPQLALLTVGAAISELNWKFQFGHEKFLGKGSLS